MDWTDFHDNQATIILSLVTRHGRATPLLWLTVDKATLKDRSRSQNGGRFEAPEESSARYRVEKAAPLSTGQAFGTDELEALLNATSCVSSMSLSTSLPSRSPRFSVPPAVVVTP